MIGNEIESAEYVTAAEDPCASYHPRCSAYPGNSPFGKISVIRMSSDYTELAAIMDLFRPWFRLGVTMEVLSVI